MQTDLPDFDSIHAEMKKNRAEAMARWADFRQGQFNVEGQQVIFWEEIEPRLDVDPKSLPLTGVIGAWVLRKSRYGVFIITGHCHLDLAGRGFAHGPIQTSAIVKIENGYAITLNSVYRLISDEEHDAVLCGDLDPTEITL